EAPLVFVAGGMWLPRSDDVRVFHEGGRRLAWVGTPSPEVKATIEREEGEEEERLMYVALTRAMGRVYLPYVLDAAGEPKSLRGPYGRVHGRLAALVQAEGPILTIEEVGAAGGPDVAPPAPADWTPPPALLRENDEGAHYEELRQRHAAAIVTSYTRMRGAGGARPSRGESVEELRVDKSGGAIAPTSPRSSTRRGRPTASTPSSEGTPSSSSGRPTRSRSPSRAAAGSRASRRLPRSFARWTSSTRSPPRATRRSGGRTAPESLRHATARVSRPAMS